MAASSCEGERRHSLVEEEIGEGGGRSRAGGKEMGVAAARRLQDARRGHGKAGGGQATPACSPRRQQLALASVEKTTGGARWAGPAGLGGLLSPGRQVSLFPFSV